MYVPRIVNQVLGPKGIPLTRTGRNEKVPGELAGAFDDVKDLPPFVLMLRTFGGDGDLVLGDADEGPGYALDALESITSRVVRQLHREVVFFYDEKSSFIPSGPRVFSIEHDRWRPRFKGLTSRADAIVVVASHHP